MVDIPLLILPGWLVNCCCCALIITKLEAKRMKAMANVNPIADLDETDNGEDLFLVSRIREKIQNNLRLLSDYSVRTFGNVDL